MEVISLMDLVAKFRALSHAESLLRSLVNTQLSSEYKKLDAYWKQRYTYRLCKLGDENTAFFHANASARLRRNQIKVLHSDGRPVTNHGDKERVLHAFYSALLGTTSPVVWDPNLAALLPPIAGLSSLELPFSEEELKKALWSMRSDSSPGPDGFGPAFFKAFWPVVKDDLLSFVMEFHSGGAHLSGVNQAFIALLPKTAEVVTADGFHPISLQNCVMKIITRILTTRL
jgi:hypothetical protein